MPYTLCSRPRPLCFMPPKGATSLVIDTSFRPICVRKVFWGGQGLGGGAQGKGWVLAVSRLVIDTSFRPICVCVWVGQGLGVRAQGKGSAVSRLVVDTWFRQICAGGGGEVEVLCCRDQDQALGFRPNRSARVLHMSPPSVLHMSRPRALHMSPPKKTYHAILQLLCYVPGAPQVPCVKVCRQAILCVIGQHDGLLIRTKPGGGEYVVCDGFFGHGGLVLGFRRRWGRRAAAHMGGGGQRGARRQ